MTTIRKDASDMSREFKHKFDCIYQMGEHEALLYDDRTPNPVFAILSRDGEDDGIHVYLCVDNVRTLRDLLTEKLEEMDNA